MQIHSHSIINSCQNIIISISNFNSTRNFLLLTALFLAISFFIKLLVTFQKNVFFERKFYSKRIRHLPKKISKVLSNNKLDKNKVIIISSPKKFAFLSGITAPKIFISTQLIKSLNQKELEAVLLHEFFHFNHKHSQIVVFSQIMSSVFVFFPLIKDLSNYLRNYCEIMADSDVLKKQKTNTHIKKALLKTISPIHNFVLTFSSPLASDLELRIDHLNQKEKQLKFKTSLTNFFFSIAVLIFFIFTPTLTKNIASASNQHHPTSRCAFFECLQACIREEIMSINQNQSRQVYQSFDRR